MGCCVQTSDLLNIAEKDIVDDNILSIKQADTWIYLVIFSWFASIFSSYGKTSKCSKTLEIGGKQKLLTWLCEERLRRLDTTRAFHLLLGL